jgi:membrane-anchored mycosin MYCP
MTKTRLRGRNHAFSYPEIVVAYKHRRRVIKALKSLHIEFGEVQEDAYLGLALIPLQDYTDAMEKLRPFDDPRRQDERREAANRAQSQEDEPSAADLDVILRGLRGYFAEEYAGWTPLIGKNRLVGSVIGTPGKVTHGGGSALAQTTKTLERRMGKRGTGVVVGVLDTQLAAHPWLAGGTTSPPDAMLQLTEQPPDKDAQGVDIVDLEKYPNAASGHATFVAGEILKVAPSCTVNVWPVLDTNGEASSWDVAKGIVAMARTKPDIINLSVVCYTEDGQPPLVLATAIDRVDPATVIVAAAGNHGDVAPPANEREVWDDPQRKPGWPAALDGVVAVGSGTGRGEPADFTPHRVGWIDVLADGDHVVSTFPTGYFSVVRDDTDGEAFTKIEPFTQLFMEWGGTSFAAAYVSGAIAAKTVPGSTSPRQALELLVPPTSDDLTTITRESNEDVTPYVYLEPDEPDASTVPGQPPKST